MDDKIRRFAELSYTKEKFLFGVREFMAENVGDRVPELMDRVVAIYEEEYPAYLETYLVIIRENYTPEQLDILIEVHTQYPWMLEKFEACLTSSFEKNQDNSERVGQRVNLVVEAFLEEIEGTEEDEHPRAEEDPGV